MSPKEQDGTQSRRTETGGSPHPPEASGLMFAET